MKTIAGIHTSKLNTRLVGPILTLSLIAFFTLAMPAHAYLDPGTGSVVLQLILGGVAGALVVIKLYWHRFTSFFRRDSTPPSNEE